jgi:hypothetical protein
MNERNFVATMVFNSPRCVSDQYHRSVYVDIDPIANQRKLSAIDEYTIEFNFTY